jgi:hypothetical protein
MAGLLVAGAVAAVGCSSSETSTNPSPTKCQVSINPAAPSIGAAGGTTTVSVSAQPECAWTVAENVSWIASVSPANGQGNGEIEIRVAANADASARNGTVQINDTSVRVSQDAAACNFTVAPLSVTARAGGDTAAVNVTAAAGCSWTAVSAVPWITIASGAGGSGAGTVSLRIAANTGPQRTGTVTIAGQTYTVTQPDAASTCVYTIAPTTQASPAAGGPGSVAVTTTAACAWTATSAQSWIAITAGSTGTGNGTVGFTVAANTGAERTGTITIAGQTFTVTQAATVVTGPCPPTIAPTTQTVGNGGGPGTTIAVTAAAGCAWTAASTAPWITGVTPASASGNGSVNFNVAANTNGSTRTGTIIIGGHTFSVTQNAGCAYNIAPPSQSVGANAGPGTAITISAGNGCAWTATSNVTWITFTGTGPGGGDSGSGNGTVNFRVAANTGAARSGIITIAGQTSTVNQAAAPCSYDISPNGQNNAPAGGGPGTAIAVTARAGCAWTAASNAPWITAVAPASGSGNGTVNFTILANTGAQRTGTLTVAGQTFTVMQAAGAVACAYAILPTSQPAIANGGPGVPVAVTTTPGCAWTAVSNAPWITAVAPASSTGVGVVNFTVASNPGAARNGTITIAGQTMTVNQAGR